MKPLKPTDTDVWIAYVNRTAETVYLSSFLACNVTGAAATYSVGIDYLGRDTLGTDNALAWQVPLDAKAFDSTKQLDFDLPPGARILVQSGTGGAITYTLGVRP